VKSALREVIEDALSSTSQLFSDKAIALELKVPADLPTIVADRDRPDAGHAEPAVQRGQVLRRHRRQDHRALRAGRRRACASTSRTTASASAPKTSA
jgi:hypothetical protein